jgi:hypothetical protein
MSAAPSPAQTIASARECGALAPLNWAVAGAECNTVIELRLEHHAA